jgi:hypothetical protein
MVNQVTLGPARDFGVYMNAKVNLASTVVPQFVESPMQVVQLTSAPAANAAKCSPHPAQLNYNASR